jgi:hypothetical protein
MPLSKIKTNSIADEVFETGSNMLINGGMTVSQRGTSQTNVTIGGYLAVPDRFIFQPNSAGAWSVSQSTTTPVGFSNSYKLECTTADASLAAGDYVLFEQRLEGQNLQHLKKGTSSAESVTVSFWVRSAKTGTYIVEIDDNDNTRNINKSYTISSADTWEHKTITFEGDTTGALDNDNNFSLRVIFWLAAGSDFSSGTLATTWQSTTNANRVVGNVNLADTVGNDWYITGIQLELGEQATPFEHRSFDDELDRCKRYYQKSFAYETAPANDIRGARESEMPPSDSISYGGAIVYLEKTMRAAPTCVAYNPLAAPANSGAYINDLVNGSVTTEYTVSSIYAVSSKVRFYLSTAPTIGGNPYGCNWTAEAEL